MPLNPKQQRRIDTAPEKWRGLLTRAIEGKASPRAAIKAQCGECNGFDRQAIATCSADACPLWMYRPCRNRLKPSQASRNDSKDELSDADGANMPPGNRCPVDGEGRAVVVF